jgi:RNA polymerase sigma-70 factor (ECF subfamily)
MTSQAPRRAATDEIPDDLVRAAATGDRQAVTTLLQTISPTITRFCRSKLAGHPAADDAAQETCIAVLRALPSYRFEGRPFGAFVYTVAGRKCIDVHRADARAPQRELGDPAEKLAALPSTETADGSTWAAQDAAELEAMLSQLTDHQREIIRLRITEGLTAPEIAERLGEAGAVTTPGAVRIALHRGITTLRRIVTREGAA